MANASAQHEEVPDNVGEGEAVEKCFFKGRICIKKWLKS
jgi:hypothetical protein